MEPSVAIPVLRFETASRSCALPRCHVAGPIEAGHVREVPGTPPEVLGLTVWRDLPLTVLDPAAMMGDPLRPGPTILLRLAEPYDHVAIRIPADHRAEVVCRTWIDSAIAPDAVAHGSRAVRHRRPVLLDPAKILELVERRIAELASRTDRRTGLRRATGGA